MSYKRRKAQIHQAQMHEYYDAPSGNEMALTETDSLGYDPAYPGPREGRILDADNWNHSVPTYDPQIRDNVDWAAGGEPGHTKAVGSVGVTDPQNVDTHDFRGYTAVIRRMPDTNYGPVKGGQDHNSLLSLLYSMQESNAFFPGDIAQQDIIKGV